MKDQYSRRVHFSSSAPLLIFFWHTMANQSYLEFSANTSHSMENNLTHEHDYGKYFLSFLVIASTFLGNSVIIFSYCQNYKMRTATNTMVLNHCLADMLLVLSDIAFYLTPSCIPSLMDSDLFCTLSAFFDSLFKAASILSMCGIALDRYVHLVRNSRRRMSEERTMMVIAWCWLQSVVVATPWNKLTRLENIVNKRTPCPALPSLFEAGLPLTALSVFFKIVSILLPLLGICYVSYRVFSTVRQRRKVETHEGSLQVARRVPSEGFVTRAHARSPITAIILLVVYILSMTPFSSQLHGRCSRKILFSPLRPHLLCTSCFVWKELYFQSSTFWETVSFSATFTNLCAVVSRRRQVSRNIPTLLLRTIQEVVQSGTGFHRAKQVAEMVLTDEEWEKSQEYSME